MKKLVLIAIAGGLIWGLTACESPSKVIDAAHNSRNSLSWAGIYAGIIPAADCPGIDVQIALNYNETYTLKYQYIDRGSQIFTDSGTFKWDKSGSIITLDTREFSQYYKVEENQLVHLDMHRKRIQGKLADNYILKKVSNE